MNLKRLAFWKRPPRCPHTVTTRVRSAYGYECVLCRQPVRLISLYMTAAEQVQVIRGGWKIR